MGFRYQAENHKQYGSTAKQTDAEAKAKLVGYSRTGRQVGL